MCFEFHEHIDETVDRAEKRELLEERHAAVTCKDVTQHRFNRSATRRVRCSRADLDRPAEQEIDRCSSDYGKP